MADPRADLRLGDELKATLEKYLQENIPTEIGTYEKIKFFLKGKTDREKANKQMIADCTSAQQALKILAENQYNNIGVNAAISFTLNQKIKHFNYKSPLSHIGFCVSQLLIQRPEYKSNEVQILVHAASKAIKELENLIQMNVDIALALWGDNPEDLVPEFRQDKANLVLAINNVRLSAELHIQALRNNPSVMKELPQATAEVLLRVLELRKDECEEPSQIGSHRPASPSKFKHD
jgi:hypothetical protein